ncbi:hypothetical protein SAMN06298210_1301, partial [Prevotellaceae bacterium KH2P17]
MKNVSYNCKSTGICEMRNHKALINAKAKVMVI